MTKTSPVWGIYQIYTANHTALVNTRSGHCIDIAAAWIASHRVTYLLVIIVKLGQGQELHRLALE